MKPPFPAAALATLVSLSSASMAIEYQAPEALVAPSAFKGVHGLAVDQQGRLLAGSVVGNSIYQVDIDTGEVTTFIGPDQGQADDIAIGPKGELAWTGFYAGQLLIRDNDDAPIRVVASDLPGMNSLDFNDETGQLYASQVFLGDALWEIDPTGKQQPRLIAKDLGGFNGFEVGRDGWLYGPLWFKGEVVRINPADGRVETLATGFGTPAAANFDSKGNLYALDTLKGLLKRIDLSSGETTDIAKLSSSLDNLAIDSQDRIFVSNMADNSIQEVNPATGKVRLITGGELAVPAGISLSEDGQTLYVADVFAFRKVDTATGKVTDLRRAHGSDVEYPISVSLGKERLLLTSFSTGTLQVISRSDDSTLQMLHGLDAPSGAVELDNGDIVVSQMGSGKLLRFSGASLEQRAELATGLQGPVQMIRGRDGHIYLTEMAGFLTRVNPADGKIERLAEGLQLPEGLSETADGHFIVAEGATKRLLRIDPATGDKVVIASDLPIGLAPGPGMPPTGIPTGVAVATDGSIYFSSDIDNGLYRLSPQ
ncbi:Vgb family protein [Halopseudomonas sp.]|uniref:Vgb family protein n=1 Tax=Halopseudomonas sp. TaxID=2901191 RepID=UPI00300376D2